MFYVGEFFIKIKTMEPGLILSFLGASIILTIMPGPDNIFVLTESLTKGQRNGIAISVGLCTGVLIHTLAAATGLSIIIQKSAIAFSMIKYLGAGYLFYLAYQAYGEAQPTIDLTTHKKAHKNEATGPLIKKGFLMNILNPKVSLFFIAFLPQFITNDGMNVTLQMMVLGVVFMMQALVIFSAISILSGSLTRYVTAPNFWKTAKWSKIMVLIILGLVLVFSEK